MMHGQRNITLCNMCLLWRSWDFKCLLHRKGSLHAAVATQLWERAYLMYTARPTVRRVYSTEHRIDVHCDLTVSCCLGQCRRYPLTRDWKVTNTRHVHPWISKRVLKREKERDCVCASIGAWVGCGAASHMDNGLIQVDICTRKQSFSLEQIGW